MPTAQAQETTRQYAEDKPIIIAVRSRRVCLLNASPPSCIHRGCRRPRRMPLFPRRGLRVLRLRPSQDHLEARSQNAARAHAIRGNNNAKGVRSHGGEGPREYLRSLRMNPRETSPRE